MDLDATLDRVFPFARNIEVTRQLGADGVFLAVQVPLYLAGELSWLAISRVALGWPLHAATLAIAGLMLLRGKTPLPGTSGPTSN